ncbi:cytochrome P460 family protein [Pseudodesulfovibrio thermohalotolerans]|uniref:cytochrome P460 family protein n=1 Tax=Pseudodesulfovibrio thermohalotolerans TaxID=2880651 RepID=UPI002441449A|nr:cytochrome P460 family protein [Pseudodesulfovibrio thermohalotolerans]WFS61978.1 cytochrome P460 family protein [Pseudodesulfovibrio thermohalotolerans]
MKRLTIAVLLVAVFGFTAWAMDKPMDGTMGKTMTPSMEQPMGNDMGAGMGNEMGKTMDGSMDKVSGMMPGAESMAVWKYITEVSPYRKWGQFPDHMGMQKGKSPHGALHEVYVNKAGLMKGTPKPVGAMVVKDNFNSREKLKFITVMYKVAGYNPSAGDWYWVEYSAEGKVLVEGPGSCAGCHSARAANDYIMVSDH